MHAYNTDSERRVCALQCNGTNDEKEEVTGMHAATKGIQKDGEGSRHVGIQVHKI